MSQFISSYQKALDNMENQGRVKSLSYEALKDLDRDLSKGFLKTLKEFKKMISLGFITFNKSL